MGQEPMPPSTLVCFALRASPCFEVKWSRDYQVSYEKVFVASRKILGGLLLTDTIYVFPINIFYQHISGFVAIASGGIAGGKCRRWAVSIRSLFVQSATCNKNFQEWSYP